MIRRDFIRLLSLTTGSLPFTDLTTSVANGFLSNEHQNLKPGNPLLGSSVSHANTYEIFLHPPNKYRPMVRWWWNGDRISRDEILRELDVLKAAGIGGVEINPIKFPNEADPMDTKALTWLSDEWIEMLEVAVKGTKERDMTCDMIVGSGWPYGGEFLNRDEQTKMVALGTKNISGQQRLQLSRAELLDSVSPSFVSPYKDCQKELFGLVLVPSQMSAVTQGISLDEQLVRDLIEINVPAGDHVLYFLVKLTGFMAVINGAPGATGPVLNHYSAQAVKMYLDRLSDRLSAKLGPLGDHFRAFFTDSIELEGANWCDDMFSEFQRRRGYDLSPWLPFVLFKVGEMGNAVTERYGATFSPELKEQTDLVRYDFETTKHELFQERFVATFASWCTRVGVKSRMQAYGMDCDAIESGMMLDIPECETWIQSEKIEDFGTGDYRHGRSYTMINKFVSSSAHLAGKQLISCEEMTNTADPFHASMERIKVAGDQSILSGVTQSVLHGFNYSPLETPFPGWVRYGTYFSERNTWWPYFKLWVDYKARLSALFQHSVMHADIAILPPLADLASKYGFQRDPFPKIAYPSYVYKLWEVVHQNGSGCDYLTEEVINNSVVRDGRLVFRSRSYRAILFPEVESINPATAKILVAFVESGGILLFINKAPHLASGLVNNAAGSDTVHGMVQSIMKEYPLRAAIVTMDEANMVDWYRSMQVKYSLTPDVLISNPTDFVSQLRYVNGSQDIFFFTNYGPQKSHTFEASFTTGDKSAWLWNPESGARAPYPVRGPKNVLTITLGPSESKLIVFDAASSPRSKPDQVGISELTGGIANSASREQVIPGPWNLTLNHVDGTVRSEVLQNIADFDENKDLESFAGTIIYKNQFQLESPNKRIQLDLGHVHCISELEVNGHPMGLRWYGNHVYDISSALTPGINYISIKVVTTLGNYMKTLTSNATARVWTEDTPVYPITLTNPVRLIWTE